MSDATAPSEMTYEAALNELERLVAELDEGDIDIDTLGQRFERAIRIVEELDSRILRSKQQVEKLLPRLDDATKQSSAD